MKNILVTGAGGFIGSHLTELLVEKGYNVKAFVHYNSWNKWGWLDSSKVKNDINIGFMVQGRKKGAVSHLREAGFKIGSQ